MTYQHKNEKINSLYILLEKKKYHINKFIIRYLIYKYNKYI